MACGLYPGCCEAVKSCLDGLDRLSRRRWLDGTGWHESVSPRPLPDCRGIVLELYRRMKTMTTDVSQLDASLPVRTELAADEFIRCHRLNEACCFAPLTFRSQSARPPANVA